MNHYYSEKQDSESNKKEIVVTIFDKKYKLITDNGVFSKSGLDFGTRLLIETLPKLYGDVLDLGCGYGPIGIILKDKFDICVTMSDINERALSLSKINIKNNKVDISILNSDGFKNINKKFNFIVTNPPIRIGKQKLVSLLREAHDYLSEEGELWFVIRKNHGAESVIKLINDIYAVDIVKKSKGFYIIKSKPIDL